MLSVPQIGSTFTLNDAQKLDHCFTITICFSVALQDVADSESRFNVIDIDAYRKRSDGATFFWFYFITMLGRLLYLLYHKSASFGGSGTEMPFVILGNKAYPLNTFLMKPLVRKNMSCAERVFHCGQSQARRCAECAFGVLIAKWRLLILWPWKWTFK